MSDNSQRLNAALEGRYRIERQLGEGGMATVYLAEDVKHQRKVALKVLRPELAAVLGGERFLSEIRTTANLQHPHILPLFDSGAADGFLYYVMPYIDGETLRDKLDREKQLGVNEAVRVAKSVADALDYAHRQGVIHRDIKPANILLHDGRPMVADFGIAVALSAAGGGRMTETGLSLGTPHYMSPEQASADRDLSARSDVYSLGCVLYEMIAGQPPHTGPSAQSILVRMLTESPRPLTELRHTVPPHVSAVAMKAIEKLPADRFESARAFMDALEDDAFTYAPTQHPAKTAAAHAAPPARGAGRPAWAVTAAVGVLTAVIGIVAGRQFGETPTAPAPRALFELATDSTYTSVLACCGAAQAVSPDGTRLAYLSSEGEVRRIFVRAMDQFVGQPVQGSDGARHPVFSPDGTWLAFNSATALMKVPTEGGTPMTVAGGVGTLRGITWLEDNTVIFATVADDGLYRVSADGGTPEILTTPDTAAGERAHRYPHGLPGSSVILFTVMPQSRQEVPTVEALDLDSGRRTPVLRGSSAWYIDDGHIVFGLPDGSVMAQGFDVQGMDTVGSPFRIAEGVIYRAEGLSEFGISRNGTMLSLQGIDIGSSDLVLIDRSGGLETIPLEGPFRYPRFSPDGHHIAVEREGDPDDIWIWDLSRQNGTRLTVEGDNSLPSWSPDGETVLFQRELPPADGLFQQRIDGVGGAVLVQEGPMWTAERSPDGEWLVWANNGSNSAADILARAASDTAGPRTLLGGVYGEHSPAISPDGRWLAYVSHISGQPEVYLRSFPDMGPVSKISVDRGVEPRWHPGGTAILYRTPEGELVEVALRFEGNRVVAGARSEILDSRPYRFVAGAATWDVHPDGERFVFVTGSGLTSTHYRVMLNATSRPAGR